MPKTKRRTSASAGAQRPGGPAAARRGDSRSRNRRGGPEGRLGTGGSRRSGAVAWIAGLVVLAVVLALVIVKAAGSPHPAAATNAAARTAAPPAVVSAVAGVPQSAFRTAGTGSGLKYPKPVQGGALSNAGRPVVFYAGGEFCPFCAAQRWPLAVALSRFGRFSKLSATQSSATDVYPNTQTLSFHGSTYSSPYIDFVPVEMYSNQPGPTAGTFAILDKPTQDEQTVISQYDKPPYSSSSGGIPFIDFGGRYVIEGSMFSPQVLQGLSRQQIADSLSDPSSDSATDIDASANIMTAAICRLTAGRPGSVCSSPGVKAADRQLPTK